MFWLSLLMSHGNIINIHSEQKNGFYCIQKHWMSHLIPFLSITLSTHSPPPFTPSKQRACSGMYNNVSWENKQILAARETQHKCFEWWNGEKTFSMCSRGVPATLSLTYQDLQQCLTMWRSVCAMAHPRKPQGLLFHWHCGTLPSDSSVNFPTETLKEGKKQKPAATVTTQTNKPQHPKVLKLFFPQIILCFKGTLEDCCYIYIFICPVHEILLSIAFVQ